MAEDLKIFLYENLQIWEGNFTHAVLVAGCDCFKLIVLDILCGPRIGLDGRIQHVGRCFYYIESMPNGPDLKFILDYYDFILVFLDKLDETVEWFSLVIGNIIDATLPSGQITRLPLLKDEL